MDDQTNTATLISFPPSAECELARWVMRHHNVDFIEKRHTLPLLPWVSRLNGGASVPLYIRGEQVIEGVRPIIDHFESIAMDDKKLIPNVHETDIEASWQSFNQELRQAVVTWAYTNLLPHRDIMIQPLSLDCPWYEQLFVHALYNVPKRILWNRLNLSKPAADEALVLIRKKFTEVDALLADGRRYLLGDRMTLADLAFAVSGAPVVVPNGYGGFQYGPSPIPDVEQFPEELQQTILAMRDTRAGQFILRMYTEERYARVSKQ